MKKDPPKGVFLRRIAVSDCFYSDSAGSDSGSDSDSAGSDSDSADSCSDCYS